MLLNGSKAEPAGALQSSTWPQSPTQWQPGRAIDGDNTTRSSTKIEIEPWLEVQFPIARTEILHVQVTLMSKVSGCNLSPEEQCWQRVIDQSTNISLYAGANTTGMLVWDYPLSIPKMTHYFPLTLCNDKKTNGDELGPDCGGSCPAKCPKSSPTPTSIPESSTVPVATIVVAVGATVVAVGVAGTTAACCAGKCGIIGASVGGGLAATTGVVVVLSRQSGLGARMADGAKPTGLTLPEEMLLCPPNCPDVVTFLQGLPPRRFNKASVKQLIDALDPFVEAHPAPKKAGATAEDIKALYVYSYELKVLDNAGQPTDVSLPHQIYKDMNTAMRTGSGLEEWHPLIYLVSSALARLPKTKCTAYRGLQGVSLEFTPKEYINWAQFSSTSSKKSVAEDFMKTGNGTMFIIKNQSGTSLQLWSDYPEEAEVVIPPNTRYQVTDVKHRDGCTMVKMHEVDDASK